jgi:hypothetical protein
MKVRRVAIVVDKTCAPGTAWPTERFENASCGGYTDINKTTTKGGMDSQEGIPPLVFITGKMS